MSETLDRAQELIRERAAVQGEITTGLAELRSAISSYVTAKSAAEKAEAGPDRVAAGTARKRSDTTHAAIIIEERKVGALRRRLAGDHSQLEVLRAAENELQPQRDAGVRAFLDRARSEWQAAVAALERAWGLRIISERYDQSYVWPKPADNISAAVVADQPELRPVLTLQEIQGVTETLIHANRVFIDQPEGELYILRKGATGPFAAGSVLSAVALNVSPEKLRGMVRNRYLLELT